MRLSLLLVLAVCVLLTEQAAAQSDLHTAWGRHLGWGAGPGYHTYSQFDINMCAALGYQHEMGCTACPSLPAQKATMIYGNSWGSISATSQLANSHRRYQTMTPRVPAKRVLLWPTTGTTAATRGPSGTALTGVTRTAASGPDRLPNPHALTSIWWNDKSGSRPTASDQSAHHAHGRSAALSTTWPDVDDYSPRVGGDSTENTRLASPVDGTNLPPVRRQ